MSPAAAGALTVFTTWTKQGKQSLAGGEQSAIQSARAQLAQADYNEELTNIRAPVDGKIIRRYANPGAGASTLNVSNMFDLEPALPHIIRAEIIESAIPDVYVGQAAPWRKVRSAQVSLNVT